LVFLVLAGVRGWPEIPGHRVEVVEPLLLGAICAALTFMDDAPWTYATAILLVIPLVVISRLLPAEKTLAHIPQPRSRSVTKSVLACLAVIVAPQVIPTTIPVVTKFPSSPNPLLDILVLSYPRPNDKPETSILSTTLTSFVPLTAIPGVSISVFTHTETHPSFAWAKDHFEHVEFYTDTDSHSDAKSGQYLHVAEALRWARTHHAEWVMLMEDDFPLCGTRGRDSLARVMQELERGRTRYYLERRGAFVGTGGRFVVFLSSLNDVN
jgi:hypothetical protein